MGFLLENEKQFEGWCEIASELAKPCSHRHVYPIFTITEGNSKNIEESHSEVLSHIQQLDSIDEAGIDAASMIPPCEEDEFVFL